MRQILLLMASMLLSCCSSDSEMKAQNNTTSNMKIKVSDGTNAVTFELNETSAAKSLYGMLPMDVAVENYSNNEKIFYPTATVTYGSDCIEGDCPAGTLALFSPWGNVVMYYGAASRYSGLYILGNAVEGAGLIKNLAGTIHIEKVGETSVISQVRADKSQGQVYTLQGTLAQTGAKGIVIQNGKKYVK